MGRVAYTTKEFTEGEVSMKSPMQIFQEMQQLETKEEMISYLQALPRKDEPWPDATADPKCDTKMDRTAE